MAPQLLQSAVELRRSLVDSLPCREKQWQLLVSLLGEGELLPANLFIYGHTATGKTHVVTTVLRELRVPCVRINCVENDTPSLLASAIAVQLIDHFSLDVQKKCTTLMDLVNLMEMIVQNPELEKTPFVIVLERSERLRSMPANTLAALLKLQELSGMNVCAILLSDIIWEKFYTRNFFSVPIKIFFPQYTKDEMIQVIRKRRPDSVSKDIYKQYSQLMVSLLSRFTRDLNEINFMMEQHLPLIINNIHDVSDGTKMFKLVSPAIQISLKNLHLRQEITKTPGTASRLTSTVAGLELPYYAKFLLLAAFLASYNSPKHDKRLYLKFHGKERKRLAKKNAATSMSRLLVGPKPFNFERLSAIFHAITDTKVPISANLGAQLNTLVHLKLLSRVGFSTLNDPKYSCAMGYDFMTQVAQSVHFSLNKYLMDGLRC